MVPHRTRGWIRFLALALILFLPSCVSQPEQTVSVLVVSPDSLRADRLSPWNADTPHTPNVERLAERGTVYLEAWATSPWTAPSMVSVFSGLYPPSHGIAYRDDTTPRGLQTLPALLADRGYRLGNFSFFSQISYFRNLGLGSAVARLTHDRVAESFDHWLRDLPAEEPFFAWVHLLETHLPYGASGYRSTEVKVEGSPGLEQAQLSGVLPAESTHFEQGDRERLLELYDRDVVEMDVALGKLLDSLESAGRAERTLVVFVADHGEELLEHGWVGHASTAVDAKLVPEILRVPMILAGPGVGVGQEVRDLVQPVDILPTVASLLGFDLPAAVDGQNLVGWGRFFGRARRFAYFDSSPGGNMTPQEMRGERIQGVTDGTCLLEIRSGPSDLEIRELRSVDRATCEHNDELELDRELGRWRADQAQQRLALLSSPSDSEPPPSREVDAFDETLELLEPRPGRILDYEETGGLITVAWTGDTSSYWIEYELTGGLAPRGSFAIEQEQVIFGPIPQGFWNDVASYSPIRIRAIDAEKRRRSPWVEIEIAEAR